VDELSNCHLISSRSNGSFKSRLALDANPSSCVIDTCGRMAVHGAGGVHLGPRLRSRRYVSPLSHRSSQSWVNKFCVVATDNVELAFCHPSGA